MAAPRDTAGSPAEPGSSDGVDEQGGRLSSRPTRSEPQASEGGPLHELAFEGALDELEDLVERLEAGDLALEHALATFERGVALSRRCAGLLDAASRRIDELVREGDTVRVRPRSDDAAPES